LSDAEAGRRRDPSVEPSESPDSFEESLRAAVREPNPGLERRYVESAVASFGRRRVQRALIDLLRTGTDADRAAAASAWYWAQPALHYGIREVLEGGPPTPESRAEYDAVADLRAEWQQAALREFVANENLDVRRGILSVLPLDPGAYPAELHGLVAEAVRLARTHPDPYLRQRVEHQM
jgi:hypothetical protein